VSRCFSSHVVKLKDPQYAPNSFFLGEDLSFSLFGPGLEGHQGSPRLLEETFRWFSLQLSGNLFKRDIDLTCVIPTVFFFFDFVMKTSYAVFSPQNPQETFQGRTDSNTSVQVPLEKK